MVDPIALHPRATSPDRLRVWLGVFNQTDIPQLQWKLNGAQVNPQTIRAIDSVRQVPEMLPANVTPQDVPRAFSGIYEFQGLQPNTTYTVTVQANGFALMLRTRTLPEAVPHLFDGWFNVLLVSCYHQAEDRSGRAGARVSRLKPASRPDLTFLLGDQVYLDLPPLHAVRDNQAELAEKFEQDYVANWRGRQGYSQILSAAPSISIPDDHEYWNNYPNWATAIPNTWSAGGRKVWEAAAAAMYDGFQTPHPLKRGEPYILDMPPLSFFLSDMRHERSEDTDHLMSDASHQKLGEWVDRLIAEKRFGVFVSGQTLFAKPESRLRGRFGDYQLANYGDYKQIINTLKRLLDVELPLVCVSGDVHWGRAAKIKDKHKRAAVHEVISSPASLVTFVGRDHVLRARASLSELFGRRSSWPRHPRPPAPDDDHVAHKVLGQRLRYHLQAHHEQHGNHVTMLGFRQAQGGVDMRISYYEIPENGSSLEPAVTETIELRSF